MSRGLLRVALLTLAFGLATYAFGWWGVPVTGVIWGVITGRRPRTALRAAAGAAIAWALLLAAPALGGAPTASFAARLARSMTLPVWALLAAELLFPFGLAWASAALGAAARGGAPSGDRAAAGK